MRLFLSIDSNDRWFIQRVKEAVRSANRKGTIGKVQLIYPSLHIGVSTGFVRMNVFKILSADVVFFNVTPKQLDGKYVVNSGVLIEYGMVQRQAASLVEIRSPRPFFRLFITRFPKHILPPLMNESDVFSFKKSTKGKIELRSTMIQMMTQAASEQRQSTRLTPAEGEKERISQEEI